MNFTKTTSGFRMTRAIACLVSMCSLIVSPISIQAATPTYDASVIAVDAPVRLAPGQTATVSVTIKNIGSATWSKTSKNFVSIYSYDNVRRTEVNSVLASSGWENAMRPARLPVATLATGGVAVFTFLIKAPAKIGKYKNDFLLVAEGLRRMGNGRFTLNLDVQTQGSVSVVPTPAPTPAILTSAPAPTTPSSDLSTGSTKWRAELSSLSGSEWQIDVGQNIFVTAALKNVGTEIWKKDGGSYVSVYAVTDSKERNSAFRDDSWTGSQAAKMVEIEVKPGQIAHFKIEMRGPRAPGAYREEFMLAAEDVAWISGSRFVLPIVVPLTGEFIATAAPGQSVAQILSQTSAVRGGTYSTTLLLRSLQSITLAGTTRQEMTVGFKNTGTAPWNIRGLKVKGVTPALTGVLSSVRDDTWRDLSTPVQVAGVTNPGEIGYLTFNIKTPPKKGSYQASFQLYADNQPVDGGAIDIPITVTSDGYIEPIPVPAPAQATQAPGQTTPIVNNTPSFNAIPLTGDVSSLPDEPMIRAGIFATTDDRMIVKARFAPLEVRSGGPSGAVACTLALGQSVTITYVRSSSIYTIAGDCFGQSSTWYVVHAVDGISPMEMSDFSRPVSWLPGANDNTFRANLELRYASQVDQTWVINELPIEYYLKGIAETSNVSPMQYQRTLLTAARTYAMYHVQRGTKHAARNFIIDATYDQVYRGYGAEARSPTIVAAVEATRGQIVTYQGKLALTPYFSRSDGRTRSWGEVWYGQSSYPWLVSVPVPDDVGKTLWGHGVGMSATGALQMDAKWGMTYDQILAHFYTGTELRRIYK